MCGAVATQYRMRIGEGGLESNGDACTPIVSMSETHIVIHEMNELWRSFHSTDARSLTHRIERKGSEKNASSILSHRNFIFFPSFLHPDGTTCAELQEWLTMSKPSRRSWQTWSSSGGAKPMAHGYDILKIVLIVILLG